MSRSSSSNDHKAFKFSVTCHTDDPATLSCLRALCGFVEKHKKPQISWSGTSEAEWRAADNHVTFRFTSPQYRQDFINEATRLLDGNWSFVAINDADPAKAPRGSR